MPTVCIYRLLKVSGFICENGHLSELVGCAMFQLYDAVHILKDYGLKNVE